MNILLQSVTNPQTLMKKDIDSLAIIVFFCSAPHLPIMIRWYISQIVHLHEIVKKTNAFGSLTQFNIIYFPSFCDYFSNRHFGFIHIFFWYWTTILQSVLSTSTAWNCGKTDFHSLYFFSPVLHIDIKATGNVCYIFVWNYYLTLEKGTQNRKPHNRITKAEDEDGSQLKRYWERTSKRMKESMAVCECLKKKERKKEPKKNGNTITRSTAVCEFIRINVCICVCV